MGEIVPLLRLSLCAVSSVVCRPSVRLSLCYPRLDFACALSGVSGNRIGCGLLAFSARRCFVFLGCGFALSVWRAGVFAWVLPVFSMVGGAAGMPLAGFLRFSDTPVEPFVRNGFGVVGVVSGCVVAGRRVCLSLAAQHGGLAPGGRGGLLVRWWFENSRAYLYYFFYKSMIASPSSASLGEWPGGLEGRWGFRAMRLSL